MFRCNHDDCNGNGDDWCSVCNGDFCTDHLRPYKDLKALKICIGCDELQKGYAHCQSTDPERKCADTMFDPVLMYDCRICKAHFCENCIIAEPVSGKLHMSTYVCARCKLAESKVA
jgi:hypothetical protein